MARVDATNGERYVTQKQFYDELGKIRLWLYLIAAAAAGQYTPVASDAIKQGALVAWRFLT